MADIKTILVVDDDPAIARLVAVTLEDDGYTAEVLTDGRELVDRAQKLRPDLILLDAVMPFLSLEELLRQLHATPATRGIPVLLVTADIRTIAEVDRWQAFGVIDYVRKPFDLDDLSAKVKLALPGA